jgi:hypothetical protein
VALVGITAWNENDPLGRTPWVGLAFVWRPQATPWMDLALDVEAGLKRSLTYSVFPDAASVPVNVHLFQFFGTVGGSVDQLVACCSSREAVGAPEYAVLRLISVPVSGEGVMMRLVIVDGSQVTLCLYQYS